MKASRFIKAFETDVDRWEKILSNILEVIEILLLVQKEWMYLEVGTFYNSHWSKIGGVQVRIDGMTFYLTVNKFISFTGM